MAHSYTDTQRNEKQELIEALRSWISLIELAPQHIYVPNGHITVGNHRVDFPGVGPHVRHCMETVQALIFAKRHHDYQLVDYDERKRDMRLQTEPDYCIEQLEELIAAVGSFRTHPEKCRVFDGTNPANRNFDPMPSTLTRELAVQVGHSVHHLAIVKLALQVLGYKLSADLGKTPTTLQYEKDKLEAATS